MEIKSSRFACVYVYAWVVAVDSEVNRTPIGFGWDAPTNEPRPSQPVPSVLAANNYRRCSG